ncbi:hypothetical protein [Mycolicibacterium mengxianglii]|uniref:hypothetical protein n=1 Tax=Mycolicibacterium mengxianglii TaxID=2736649 RepID=UPI0018D12BD7|nr:hypothetical protein [Mycolicibacterium mengxianglii]
MQAPGDPPSGVRRSRAGVLLASLALVIACAALGLWVYTWLQSRETQEYTLEQQAAAKATACSAYSTVRTGVATNTNLTPPGGEGDVTGALAVAANARVALISGGEYVLNRLDPATPAQLADPLRQFGNALMDFGAAATAGALNTDPGQAALLQQIDGLNATLGQLCG